MKVIADIPSDLPPGHGIVFDGGFVPEAPAPFLPIQVTSTGEVTSNRRPPVVDVSRRGRLQHRRFAFSRFALREPGGRHLGRRFRSDRFSPRPVRELDLDEIKGFGLYGLEVKTVDPRGQESSTVASVTVLLAPPPLGLDQQALQSYDGPTDVAVFSGTHE